MLSCRELTELVTDYLEGQLSFPQRARFQIHVAMCRNCHRYLRQIRMTIRTLAKLRGETSPTGIGDRLMERFRRRKPEARRWPGSI